MRATDLVEVALAVPGAVQYMDVSPRQMVSVATALIPLYLEHDDANRAPMVLTCSVRLCPLLESEAVVGTGMEKYAH